MGRWQLYALVCSPEYLARISEMESDQNSVKLEVMDLAELILPLTIYQCPLVHLHRFILALLPELVTIHAAVS